MAMNKTRRYPCEYCIERFLSRRECKTHPCYAVKNETEDTKWSTDMIMLLISLYQEHRENFQLVNIYNRAFLHVIAGIMRLQGCQDVTGDMCYNKWMGLRRLYMDEKTEQMNITRRSRMAEKFGQASSSSEFKTTFQYFDALDSVLGQDPDIVGIPGTIDTSDPDMIENFDRYHRERNAAKRARKRALQQEVDLDDTENDEFSTKLPYRYRSFLRRMDKKEEKLQRHHEEQQALRRECLDILRNILNNIESASSTLHHTNKELNNVEDMIHEEMLVENDNIIQDNNIPNEEMFGGAFLNNPELHDIIGNLPFERFNQIPHDLMLDFPLYEVIHFHNNAEDIMNEEVNADLHDYLADGEIDIRSCFLNEFRLRNRERRVNKQRRTGESQALIRECSELIKNIQDANKST